MFQGVLLQAFEDLDVDKTGVLRPSELFEACKNLGLELSIQDAINIVNEVSRWIIIKQVE